MTNKEKGFTLIEVLIILALLAILGSIGVSITSNVYHRVLLKSTAVQIKEALQLAQQLSLNESKEYCVELINDKFRVREYVKNGKVVLIQQFNKNILVSKESQSRISYNRNGETSYGEFVLINKTGQKIVIDTLIGTGKVRISNVY